jgi:hypothetical protein
MSPKPGQVLKLNREHPHISDLFPYLHIDVLVVVYVRDEHFEYVCKEHIAVDS